VRRREREIAMSEATIVGLCRGDCLGRRRRTVRPFMVIVPAIHASLARSSDRMAIGVEGELPPRAHGS